MTGVLGLAATRGVFVPAMYRFVDFPEYQVLVPKMTKYGRTLSIILNAFANALTNVDK